MAENINIAGRLHSTATGNVVAGADEILYEPTGGTPKKQSEVNQETNTALADRYTKSETYSKTQLNSMITTPNQEYVTLVAESGDTLADIFDGITGAADTTYRVGNWDGSANSGDGGYDVTTYSEYAYDGTNFVHLSTKTQIGEVFDISAYHATGGTLATYTDLAAALTGTNGGVPQSLQKGGMSVKFVQSSDNKYVQYRLMANDFSTTPSDWQSLNADAEPVADSDNLVKSGGVYSQIDPLDKQINGGYIEKNSPLAYNVDGKYIDGSKTDGSLASYNSMSIAYYPIVSGTTYHIEVERTANAAAWELAYASVADGNTKMSEVLTDYGKGTWDSASFDVDSDFTGYLAVGYAFGTTAPVVTYQGYSYGLANDVNGLKNDVQDLQEEIVKKVEYTKVLSKNLINPAEVQLNKYIGYRLSTGFSTTSVQPNPLNGAACSGYIPVTAGKTYYLTRAFSSTSAAFVFLNAEYKPVSAYPALDPETGNALSIDEFLNKSRAYKAPQGAVYALICLAFSGWTNTETQIVGFQFEEGDTPTEYEPYYVREIIPNEHLSEEIAELPDRIEDLQEQIDDIVGETTKTFVYNQERDAVSYIEGKFGNSVIKNNFKVLRSVGRSGGISECFNFETFTIDGVNVHSANDDICPIKFGGNGGYLGANHGCDAFYKCVSNSHGKTYADIGAEYSDGSHSFIIMDIIDENNIILANLDSSRQYPLWEKGGTPTVATYTWVSGGTNQSSFTVSSIAMAQGKPLEKLDETKIFVDGKEVSTSGTYGFKDKIVISQNYLLANPKSVWDIVKQNVETFTGHPDYPNLTGVDYCVKLNISYIFIDAAHCFVAQTLIYLQDQLLNSFGFIQVGTIEGTSNKLYIPKALTVEGMDFRTNPSYNAADATVIRNISTDYWENQNFPPDRFIYNNANIAFNGGFLFDYGVGGENRKTHISNAFYLPTFRKVYIYGVNRMADDSRYRQSAGSHYSTVAFRIYKPGSDVGNGLFMNNCFEYDNKFYIYLDFNGTGLYTINIPEKFIGKVVTLFEKSDNVELLTPVTSDSILIDVKTANPMYGYFVGKIE